MTMPTFKQYLTEAAKPNFAPWHERDVEKVAKISNNLFGIGDTRFLKSGAVSLKGKLKLHLLGVKIRNYEKLKVR